jgi:hypothetical protein
VVEELEHLAGLVGVRPDVPADKLVRVFQKTFSQIHRRKIKFARRKSELDFEPKAQSGWNSRSTICLVGKENQPQLMVFLRQKNLK